MPAWTAEHLLRRKWSIDKGQGNHRLPCPLPAYEHVLQRRAKVSLEESSVCLCSLPTFLVVKKLDFVMGKQRAGAEPSVRAEFRLRSERPNDINGCIRRHTFLGPVRITADSSQ
jgi:hypothetical protein